MKGLAGNRRGRSLPKGARSSASDTPVRRLLRFIAVHNWHGTHRRASEGRDCRPHHRLGQEGASHRCDARSCSTP